MLCKQNVLYYMNEVFCSVIRILQEIRYECHPSYTRLPLLQMACR